MSLARQKTKSSPKLIKKGSKHLLIKIKKSTKRNRFVLFHFRFMDIQNANSFIIITGIALFICFSGFAAWGVRDAMKENKINDKKKHKNTKRIERILNNHHEIRCTFCKNTMGYINSIFSYAGVDIICYNCKQIYKQTND